MITYQLHHRSFTIAQRYNVMAYNLTLHSCNLLNNLLWQKWKKNHKTTIRLIKHAFDCLIWKSRDPIFYPPRTIHPRTQFTQLTPLLEVPLPLIVTPSPDIWPWFTVPLSPILPTSHVPNIPYTYITKACSSWKSDCDWRISQRYRFFFFGLLVGSLSIRFVHCWNLCKYDSQLQQH
jgi:hypothetical protein